MDVIDGGAPEFRFRVIRFRVMRKGKLHGFASVEINGWLEIHDIGIFDGKNGLWAALPSSSWTGKDGKTRYQPIVAFTDREQQQRFSDALVARLQRTGEIAA